MIEPGLASVTFRQKSPQEVIRLATRANMKCIEWGGDIHVPAGDLSRASRIREWTEAAGLKVSAYGSYYTVGGGQDPNKTLFDHVLQTAVTLGAPLIRIWAGNISSSKSSLNYRRNIISETRILADKAKTYGKQLAFEFHENTLNDRYEACHDLLSEIAHPQVNTLWQPMHGVGKDVNGDGINMILPWIVGVHVFHWWPAAENRMPLKDGYNDWRYYLELLAKRTDDIPGTLEFVQGDLPEHFLRDAQTWLELIYDHQIVDNDFFANDHTER